MITERSVPLTGGSVQLAVGPNNGPPLLMLHGVTRRWQSYLPLWAALSTHHQLFALDYRGHGRAARSPRGFRVVDYLEDLCELLPQHLPADLRIYGHSMGAMLAAGLAARLPERVRGIILEDPPQHTMGSGIGQTSLLSMFQGMATLAGSTRPLPEMAAAFANVVVTDPHTGKTTRLGDVRDPLSLRFTAWCLKDLQPEVLHPILSATWLDGYEIPFIYSRIQCPVLLFQADLAAGGMLSDSDAASLRTYLNDLTHLKFSGAGHLLHWLRTPEILNHTLAFLQTLT